MFVTPEQMRAHEAKCLVGPDAAARALEEAGQGIAAALRVHFPQPGTLWLFLGRGHNAGDALVAASAMHAAGWTIRHCFAEENPVLAPLTATHFAALQPHSRRFSPDAPAPTDTELPRPWVAVDGLCGIGARLPLDGPMAAAVRQINAFRDEHGAMVAAIDLPSGLDGATGEAIDPCVTADLTLTVVAVKRGLVRNHRQVGRLVLVPLRSLPAPDQTEGRTEVLATSQLIAPWLPPRPHDLHKGTAGKIAIVAGSAGMSGAAALAALGALHGGAGLVTIFTSPSVVSEVAARCPPEAMVRALPENGLSGIPVDAFDVIAIGPGCGRDLDSALPGFVRHCPLPMVLDADALNGLARQAGSSPLPFNPSGPARLLTPHPGEFARLAPDLAGLPADAAAAAFADRYPACALLLKGPKTIVARAGQPLSYNQTGHSGLASGGSGDVLTGLAAALLHRLQDPWKAGISAAWLHGRAAELTYTHGNESTESLLASTTARWLGPAYQSLVRRAP